MQYEKERRRGRGIRSERLVRGEKQGAREGGRKEGRKERVQFCAEKSPKCIGRKS